MFFCFFFGVHVKVRGGATAVLGYSADLRGAQGRHAHPCHLQGPQGGARCVQVISTLL